MIALGVALIALGIGMCVWIWFDIQGRDHDHQA